LGVGDPAIVAVIENAMVLAGLVGTVTPIVANCRRSESTCPGFIGNGDGWLSARALPLRPRRSRSIGQPRRILMERHMLTAQQGFDLLIRGVGEAARQSAGPNRFGR
jgi:hypothetical protein